MSPGKISGSYREYTLCAWSKRSKLTGNCTSVLPTMF